MTTWRDLHNEAMGWTDYALKYRRRGDHDIATQLFKRALELEREALNLMGIVDEPIYSTMYRSCATLALDCEEYRLAEQIASRALAGDPPEYLVWELREVVEQANFNTHLRLDSVKLGNEEVQMSISGGRVGYGYTLYEDWQPRLEGAVQLIQKVWDQLWGRSHVEGAASRGSKHEKLVLALSPLRPGSMAVTIRLGMDDVALKSGMARFEDVIDATLDVVETVGTSDAATLESEYPDYAHRRNFVTLVKKIAPDGDRVSQVGFTTVVRGIERTVPLKRPQSEFTVPKSPSPESRREAITGRLLSADGTSIKSNAINVIQADGTRRKIKVPPSLMDNIVKPYWNEMVTAECTVKGKSITLESIARAQRVRSK